MQGCELIQPKRVIVICMLMLLFGCSTTQDDPDLVFDPNETPQPIPHVHTSEDDWYYTSEFESEEDASDLSSGTKNNQELTVSEGDDNTYRPFYLLEEEVSSDSHAETDIESPLFTDLYQSESAPDALDAAPNESVSFSETITAGTEQEQTTQPQAEKVISDAVDDDFVASETMEEVPAENTTFAELEIETPPLRNLNTIPDYMQIQRYSNDLLQENGIVFFQTKKGKLKDNIVRLLEHTNADLNIIWDISQQHLIYNDYWISGDNVVDILDKILLSYNKPHPINAQLWLNRVVSIKYDKKNRRAN